MMSMTIVGVHSVRVRGRSFMCSAAGKKKKGLFLIIIANVLAI